MRVPYESATRMLQSISPPNSKLARSLAGRTRAADRWIAWATAQPAAPTAWIHGASVGEAQAIRPVVTRLRRIHPTLRFVHTYTSSSVEGWADLPTTERSDYLPRDTAEAMAGAFDAIRPLITLVSRGDLWPHFVNTAASRRVPLVVVGGAISPRSRRLRWPVRALLASVHGLVDRVCAVSEDDAIRWRIIGVAQDRIQVTGDPRDDAILEAPTDISTIADLVAWSSSRWTIVAGSTTSHDGGVVLSGLAALRKTHASAGAIIVPHEPCEGQTGQLLRHAASRGLRAVTWTGDARALADADVVIANVRGILASLYVAGKAAYVGGGFRRGGQHCLAEPAAYALPIVAGPLAGTAPEGIRFGSQNAIALLPSGASADQGFTALCRTWMDSPREAAALGLTARAVLHQGAADRCARAAADYLGDFGETIGPDPG